MEGVGVDTVMVIVGTFVAAASVIATGVWTVGSVRTTTVVLGDRIESLRAAIDRLNDKYDGITESVRKLEHRVTKLEIEHGEH